MCKVREVYKYTYPTNLYNYTPQAPADAVTTATQSEVYNEPLIELYSSDKKTHVGYISFCGQARTDPLNVGSTNTELTYETGVIYITRGKSLDKDKILGSLCYNTTYIVQYNADGTLKRNDDTTATATVASGKYAGKIVSVTEKLVNANKSLFKVVITYDK